MPSDHCCRAASFDVLAFTRAGKMKVVASLRTASARKSSSLLLLSLDLLFFSAGTQWCAGTQCRRSSSCYQLALCPGRTRYPIASLILLPPGVMEHSGRGVKLGPRCGRFPACQRESSRQLCRFSFGLSLVVSRRALQAAAPVSLRFFT